MQELEKSYPLVSFCIFAYNQENFIKDAINGALSQEYDHLEIIISDDCSTDRTYNKIQNAVHGYSGPHKVILNRNETNLGIAQHVNKILYEVAKGEIVLLAGGDDVSMPNRTQVSVDFFQKFPQLTSLSFWSQQVDVNLNPIEYGPGNLCPGTYSIYTLEDYLNFKDFIIFSGDSRALRRSVIDSFPPIKYASAEDITLFVRSLLIGSICYIREPLVLRRIHGSNVSTRHNKGWRKGLDSLFQQFIYDIDIAITKNHINESQRPLVIKKIKAIKNIFTKSGIINDHKTLHSIYYFLKTKLFCRL